MTAPRVRQDAAAERQWPPLTAVREAELIKAIAKHLDGSQRKAISARCKELQQDFRTRFTFEYDPDTDPTAKRNALVRIDKHARLAAEAVGDEALQDWDWLPDHHWQSGFGSYWIASQFWGISKLAKQAADKLKPLKPSREPEKDLAARFAYMLVVEFPPRRGSKPRHVSTATDDTWREKRQPMVGDEIVRDRAKIAAANRAYNEENWARLPEEYQVAYNERLNEQNRWRRILQPIAPERREQPPGPELIPLGTDDPDAKRLRRRRKEFFGPSRSPEGPFLSIAPLLFEYFTGRKPDKGLERFCRKVLDSLRPGKRRKRRAARAKIGQTAP